MPHNAVANSKSTCNLPWKLDLHFNPNPHRQLHRRPSVRRRDYWGVPYGAWKNNVCVLFDYTAQGWYPQTSQNNVAVGRGVIVLPPNA